MAKSSPFRFVTSNRSGHYSVWRGEEHVGYVAKIEHTIVDRGATLKVSAWRPTTVDRRDLAAEKTRDAAARVLWNARRPSLRCTVSGYLDTRGRVATLTDTVSQIDRELGGAGSWRGVCSSEIP